MEDNLAARTVCMGMNLNQVLFYNKYRFSYVMKEKLINKSSRDRCKTISEKCCRTYHCNAKKCIQSDPEVDTLTADIIYRRNYNMWIKGKHLVCDLMKKHINTKKNDIQPALKKMFEWFNWEMKMYPCLCDNCKSLRLFLKNESVSHIQYRCPNCLCGLEEHEYLNVSCHIDGMCQGRKMCSYCLKYKSTCEFGFMVKYLKGEVKYNEYKLINYAYESSLFICNGCFITNKRNRFINSLMKREKITKSLEPEDKKIGCKMKQPPKNPLPDDILYKDLNWENTINYTFCETKYALKEKVTEMKRILPLLERKRQNKIGEFVEKVKKVKRGECNDVMFIEQMVMLVEKKTRDNIRVNIEKGVVNIISLNDKKINL
jgi:hypothetical protein